MEQQVDPRLIAKYIIAYQQQQDNFMKYQIDTEEDLKQLKRDLIGLEYNEEAEEYLPSPYKEALINDKGANAIITFLRLRISKVTSLSDLDDEEINKRCLYFVNSLTYFLVRHMGEYKVKSLQTVEAVKDLCDDVFFTTLKKARNAGERDSLRKQYTHIESSENVVSTQKKPESSFFINPLGGAKK